MDYGREWANDYALQNMLGRDIIKYPSRCSDKYQKSRCKKFASNGCEKADITCPAIRYNPYFNIFNGINYSGTYGRCYGPCSNGYCGYYKKPWIRFRNCEVKGVQTRSEAETLSHYYGVENAGCVIQPSTINFNKFIVQYLVASVPRNAMFFGQRTKFNKLENGQTFVADPSLQNQQYSQSIGQPKTDQRLLNPFGIVIVENTIWVADQGSGLITTYDLNGNILPVSVVVQTANLNLAHPTGIVYNPGPGFPMGNGLSDPAYIMVCTQEGTVNGYNPSISASATTVLFDQSEEDALYTSIILVNNTLFLVDINNSRIVSVNNNFVINTGFPFSRAPSSVFELISTVPAAFKGYRNFAISFYQSKFFVSYVPYNEENPLEPTSGFGNGYIDIYDSFGNFIEPYLSAGVLNIPLEIFSPPLDYGFPLGSKIIVNGGDGFFLVYNEHDIFLGRLADMFQNYIRIGQLRDIAVSPVYPQTIYFVAGPDSGNSGLLGSISLNPYLCS